MNISDGIVSIDINNGLVDEIKQNIGDLTGDFKGVESFTIFRVPAHIRKKNKELYKPRMVSIGPYYHGKASYQAMEKHKWRYLRDYLSRNNRNSIEHCINELKGLESRARRCNFEEVQIQSDEFLKMMLLDGCFIVEFLIKWYDQVSDVIFDVGWVLPTIRSDLLLLENQIPFFVIQTLFGLLIRSYPVQAEDNESVSIPVPVKAPLVEMLSKFLLEGKDQKLYVLVEIKHILHLYYLCHVPSQNQNKCSASTIFRIRRWLNPIKLVFLAIVFLLKLCFKRKFSKSSNEKAPPPKTIPSATELRDAGVSFKQRRTENTLDIQFHNGTLEIPFISIEETRRSRLLNLVSFEQSFSEKHNLTSYACFMGNLIKTARDVTLLQEEGIIENLLATKEELVSFFNWLTECSFLNYEKHYLRDLFIDVNKYHDSDWHRWMATLKSDYFSNPWSVISFAAAFILMALTALQTFYTVFPYYKPRN